MYECAVSCNSCCRKCQLGGKTGSLKGRSIEKSQRTKGETGKAKSFQGIHRHLKNKEQRGWERLQRSGAKDSAEGRGTCCRDIDLTEWCWQPHHQHQYCSGVHPSIFFHKGSRIVQNDCGHQDFEFGIKWHRRVCPSLPTLGRLFWDGSLTHKAL